MTCPRIAGDQSPTQACAAGRLPAALTALAFAVFTGLLTWRLGAREFWTDEVISAGHIGLLSLTDDFYHPRGYYLLLHFWSRLWGTGDLSLRAFSVPWALLALGLMVLLGRRLLGPSQSLLATWLFVLSPFVILYFRMARFFAMVTAVFLVVLYCAVLVLQEGRWRHWIALGIASVALLHTNYVAATLLGPLVLVVGLPAVRRGQGGRLAVAVLPLLIAVALLANYLAFQLGVVGQTGAQHGRLSLSQVALRLALPLWSMAVGETTDPWRVHVTLPALGAGLGLLGLGLRTRGPSQEFRIARWAWPAAVLAVWATLSLIATGEPLSSAGRSALFAMPVACMTMAVGLGGIQRRTVAAGCLAVILAADGYGLANYFAGRQFLNPGYAVPWRQVMEAIEARQRPSDLVLAYFDTTPTRYGRLAHFINGGSPYDAERYRDVEEWPKCGRRLWLITRDRGSELARRMARDTIARLTPLAARVEVMRFMPYSPLDRKVRELVLGRQVEEAYVKVYLFVPPGDGAARSSVSP